LRLVLLREIPDDPDLRRAWNGLVERVEQPQVFFTYDWALAVQRAYSATLHPLIVLAYDEQGKLIGVVALAAGAAGQISFLCATTGDYCDFLSLPGHKSAFVDAVMRELSRQGVKNVTLTNLPADSSTVDALRQSAQASGYYFFARTAYICAQVSLDSLERRPGEDKPVLPRKKMLRRFLNAMGREAPVILDHARTWDKIGPVLPSFMQSHVARFLVTGRISNMARTERRVFLAELAKLLSENGWLVLTRMMAGSKTFAWNYGFQFQDTWFWYQPTFDSDLEKYSPGFCLLAKVIEEAADSSDFKTVDLGLGAEEYKERFANRSRETLYVTLKTSGLRHVCTIARDRAVELLRANPAADSAVRAAAERMRGLRERAAVAGAGSVMRSIGLRLRNLISSQTEVFFYEWNGRSRTNSGAERLCPLDLEHLASAATEYSVDPSTLAYLLRAAARLRKGGAEGFVLRDAAGKPVHFAWATGFDGFFLSELNASVRAPSEECVMLFDCWTPTTVRGRGYYGTAISQIAELLRERGSQPWIFSAASNQPSLRGLQAVGFQRRYSLTRRSVLGWQKIIGQALSSYRPAAEEVSSRG
jgi:CelD/BcsL family acetyltransferase involved in cellulose biosynthesis